MVGHMEHLTLFAATNCEVCSQPASLQPWRFRTSSTPEWTMPDGAPALPMESRRAALLLRWT